MQTLHEDHLKTKASLKRREKNIDYVTDKLYRQQSFMTQVFTELRDIQTKGTGATDLNMHKYEVEFNKLNEDLRAYHEKHFARHSGKHHQVPNSGSSHRKSGTKTPQAEGRSGDSGAARRLQSQPMATKGSSKEATSSKGPHRDRAGQFKTSSKEPNSAQTSPQKGKIASSSSRKGP